MALILAEEAPRRALRRLIASLRYGLPLEAPALNDLPFPLPLPPPTCYFQLGTSEDMARILAGPGAGVFVFPNSPNQLLEPRTGSAQQHGRLDRSEFKIVCLFRALAGHEVVEQDGYELSSTEVVYQTADRIRGALVLALSKYAIDQDNIHDLTILTHYADYQPTNNGALTGRAVLEVRITQDVLLPQPTYVPLT